MPWATSDVQLFQRWKDQGPGEPLSGAENPCPASVSRSTSIQHNLVKHPLKHNYRIDRQERIGSVLITSLTITEMPRNIPKNICKLNEEADLFPSAGR